MASTVTIDLRHVARGLDFPLRQVQAVVELLDEGNTVPFITRYRKDQTGGLDEEQIREIQDRLAKMRLLADRKQTILRSIEAQGKLTEKLAKQILSAMTTKRLEDLYLPYKPKKQTLATLARSRGLEELAREILEAAPSADDLDARSRDFANPDRQVPSGADALLGAGHILAEQFSERADLRQRLREILQKTGKIVTTQIAPDPVPAPPPTEARVGQAEHDHDHDDGYTVPATVPDLVPEPDSTTTGPQAAQTPSHGVADVAEAAAPALPEVVSAPVSAAIAAPAAASVAEVRAEKVDPAPAAEESSAASAHAQSPASHEPPGAAASDSAKAAESPPAGESAPLANAPPLAVPAAARRARDRERAKAEKLHKKEAKKKKIEERRVKAFRDYFNYAEDIKKIPPHRVLAINRAERAKILRVKVDCHLEAMGAALEEILVPPGHPHADYLRGCARDALSRLILPALEREARRELTDRAETHAVGVFARNLRNLLLQPPIHHRRVLAVDPGFKSGCKLAALDQFGNMLGHDVIYLIGSKPGRKEEARQKAIELIRKHELTVVAIGNGTACRETEEFFAEMLGTELKDQGVAYVIVNEAGASVYSTSQLGREEFPEYDATLRGAVSIGRRLLDPLSELVKIDPANIGVGLYQHDVKAKHLEASLDEVVESCVNYVGVDVNTASPALLRYVSGLNQLTARRVYEYRRENGPFRSREQLRQVPGFGDATFVQAAGFLKIAGGENPLDSTWIHPESYPLAARVLERFGGKPSDLTEKEAATAVAQRMAAVDLEGLARDLLASVAVSESPAADAAPAHETASDPPAADVGQTFLPGFSAEAAGDLPAATAEVSRADHDHGYMVPDMVPEPDSCGETASGIPTATSADAAAPGIQSIVAPACESPSAAKRTAVGTLTLQDILAQLARPGRDPREDLPAPVFKQGILKLEDLAPGMELTGTVLNVVDFGCFVDIGMHDSGLVHVSRLADRFIRDPHEVVAVGVIVKVWVMEVDKERRRVSLTMVRPGSERPSRAGSERPSRPGSERPSRAGSERPSRPARGEGGASQQAGQEQAGHEQAGHEQAGHDQAGHDQAGHEQGRGGQQGDRPPRGGQGRQGGRRDGQQGRPANQQGGRPQGGRPQGGRPQGARPQSAGGPQQGAAPQGEGGPGGKPRDDRRGYGGPQQRRPRPQGPAPGRPHEFKGKPQPRIPISDEMKKGKEPMRTFGDLMQFFEAAKTDDQKPSVQDDKKPVKKEQGKPDQHAGQQGKTPGQIATDGPVAHTATESAAPPEVNVVDSQRGSPPLPLSPESSQSASSTDGEPSPEPQASPGGQGP